MSAASDHIPTPTQESALHPFYVRCSCGWRTTKYAMTKKGQPTKHAWSDYRRHWHQHVVSDPPERARTPVMEAVAMFDPKEYDR